MFKICMVVHQYYYRDPRVRRYAESLVDAGSEVDVICVRDPDQPPTQPKSGVRVFTIPFSRGYGSQGSYFLEYAVAFVLYTLWLLALHLRNRYALVHVHNTPDFLIFTALIPRLLGARLILDIHDPMPEFYMSKYQKPPTGPAIRWLELQEKLSTRVAHEVITANPIFKENLVSRGIPADKVTVVQNVPDLKIFRRDTHGQARGIPRPFFTLIYPGTIAPRYGLDVAIRALPELVKTIPNIRLVIIGPQVRYVDELARLAREIGVSSLVELRPTIPVEDVPAQIAAADVGIYTALSDPHIDIAVPTKVLEYAVMGIPIIASRLKVLEVMFGQSAIMFFESGDVDQFTHCVLDLHNNPERRDELVQNADTSFLRRHTWEHEQRIYFGLLNSLLPQGRGVLKVPTSSDGQRSSK